MSGSLRVLQTLDAAGGVWRYALDLAAALRPLGVETAFLGFGPRPSPARREEAERLGPLDWSDLPLDWMVTDPAALAGVPEAVAEAAARHGSDLLHLNLPAQAAGLRTPLPVLVTSHSCVATWFRAVRGTGLPPGWEWQGDLTAWGLARADVVVAPSRAHADALRDCHGPLPRLRVVPNAVRVPAGSPADGAVAISSGRWWDDGKGGAVLDAAAARAAWPVHLLGPVEGGQGQAFRPRHARLLGDLPHAAALSAMRGAGLFASAASYEPFGLAVAEAAAMGLPLVLSDIPTFRELWAGAARLVPPGDAGAFADALDDLAAAPEERERLGALARARAAALTPEAQASAMLALYRDLAGGAGFRAAS